jgi:hypothetical protein
MTTLTPPSDELIAFMREFERQFSTGEWWANYWNWEYQNYNNSDVWNHTADPSFCTCYKFRYTPAPAHPHYDTYLDWQRLVNVGEVAKGWWIIDCDDGNTFNPKWRVDFSYYVVKTDKHPDNATPALKLIDWAKFVRLSGLMTSEGVFFGLDKNGNASLMRMIGVFPKCMVMPTNRIKIVEQTKFTHLPAGTPPPVVEGLVFEYEVISTNDCRYTYTDLKNKVYRDCVAYRVIGLAPGYTDNPELA